ncbi:MAG TPA: glucosaminidase domain-containing protein [Hyphomicrobiaceae bacterium]|nr:glucosaminidase domain-containing protein [Hyphomicrobiaceae bacterium]
MQRRVQGAYFLIAFVSAPLHFASAEGLPDIRATAGNPVPACATPGRMMAYLKSRNPEVNPRFDSVATEYMRYGEMLGVRWDYAFYQMIIETGSLSYRRDVKPHQNNFAGLGATGGGEPGESFKDIGSGVRAHLEHLLLYAGERIESPIAERTRKVQEWGVLAKWQAGFKRPINFSDLAAQWAPGSRGYGKMLDVIGERFEEFCAQPDPRPQLVQEARAGQKARAETRIAEASLERPSGADLARRAVDEGKAQENDQRLALGAQEMASKGSSIAFKLLNSAAPDRDQSPSPQTTGSLPAQPPAGATDTSPKAKDAKAKAQTNPSTAAKVPSQPPFQAASAAGAARPLVPQAPPAAQKCRVWTASYGGQKAIIIKSMVDRIVNYTVLDVNEGAEKREADAFISAYAKEGVIAGEFGSQAQALDKAFELCPEG